MSEARELISQLPPAPRRLLQADGTPHSGLYRGSVAEAGFAGLKDAPGLLQRRLLEKKWQYLFLATPEMMLALAVIDCGYLSSGICAVFDRGSRRLLVDDNPVLPPLCAQIGEAPGDGMSARLLGPRIQARLQRAGGRIAVQAKWAHADVDLLLDASQAPPPITAIAPVGAQGRFDLTQKTVLVPAEGEVRAGNVRFPVRGNLAGLDYTHGLLARETSWRWAFGGGRAGSHRVAFNFSEGFLQGEGENVAWIDGEPRAVGPVRISLPEAPSGPWRVRSVDGRVDLTFEAEGERAQTVDLKLIRSRYVQPFGTFAGTLDGVTVAALPGVTEDHEARW
ncbi:MAG TPA: DUF2804 domain-containing protein [Myxococcales bacterium]|nr:DUF2804 domain-containing protein [Myxococcales bacterium]